VERSLNRLLHLLPATKCVVACVSAFQNDESFWGDEIGKNSTGAISPSEKEN
jgi:hypothetical protein